MSLLGAANWVHRWYREGDPVPARELGEQYAATLVDGLLV
jgi:hypothetical protein